MNRQVLITRTKFWSFGVLEFWIVQFALNSIVLSIFCKRTCPLSVAVFYPEEAGHHYHHNVITMCTCVFVTRHSSLLCMLKNHRGNVATRIDHVQSGAKQSTPNPRKKGKENKTKQSKTKNSTTQQMHNKHHQNPPKRFFMFFFRLGAKKKYPIVTMPLDVTMPVDSVIHTTGIFVWQGVKWNKIYPHLNVKARSIYAGRIPGLMWSIHRMCCLVAKKGEIGTTMTLLLYASLAMER